MFNVSDLRVLRSMFRAQEHMARGALVYKCFFEGIGCILGFRSYDLRALSAKKHV